MSHENCFYSVRNIDPEVPNLKVTESEASKLTVARIFCSAQPFRNRIFMLSLICVDSVEEYDEWANIACWIFSKFQMLFHKCVWNLFSLYRFMFQGGYETDLCEFWCHQPCSSHLGGFIRRDSTHFFVWHENNFHEATKTKKICSGRWLNVL